MAKPKLIRITTVPLSLEKLLEGQLSYMKQYYNVIAVSADEERLKGIGEKEEISTFCVELTRQITPWKDLKALCKLYLFFRREKPFIVHTHTPKAGTIGMLAAKWAGVPNRLHTVAGLPLLEINGKKRKLLNFVEEITYAAAKRVYPNSFGLKDIILKEGFCKPDKLKVIANGSSNGINTQYFSTDHFSNDHKRNLRASLKITPNDFVFTFIGRIVSDKGINELALAFQQLYEKNNNIKLLLVGPKETELDPLTPETETLITTHPGVIQTGYQADVRPYLVISNVLAFPSYREGFPNVVMQAGAMGLPAIVTDINGCNEIIIEGENGVIIPPKNSEALQKAMRLLAENRDLTQSLAEKARPLIVSRYEQKAVWEAILNEYKSLEQGV